jgi:ribosomal-protein-alanine N-acetyltransferase
MILATVSHAPVLAAIHAAAFPAPAAWSADAFALQLAQPGVFGLLEEAGGMLLARIAGDEAEILTLAVAPDERRRGIGRHLVAAAQEFARQRGARAMFLEVGMTNAAARSLYATAGFVEVGRRPGYYAAGQDALVLRAALTLCESTAG